MAEGKKQVVMTGQELVNTYRNEQAKLEALQQRMQKLQALGTEAENAEEAVKAIKKAVKNEKIMVNLGAGIYTDAMLNGSDKFKTSLAGNVLQNSEYKNVLEYIEQQKTGIKKDIEKNQMEMEKTVGALNEIAKMLQLGEKEAEKTRQSQEKGSM